MSRDPFAHRRSVHDVGGLPGGPVPTEAREPDLWEKRVDAVRVLLGDEKRRLLSADQLRRFIEELPPEVYRNSSYYERWTLAIANFCIEQGLFTRAELEAEVARREERAP